MATPFFQTQANAMTIVPGSPGSVTFLTKDKTGAPIDVHTGYTLGYAQAGAAQNRNTDATPVDLSSSVTATFSTTGVTLNWTGDQAITISNSLQSTSSQAVVGLTNDAGTTNSLLAQVAVNVNNAAGLL